METNNITIKLLSDLAVGAGESYQSGVDQDIVYDDFGFPYIPAKRLKGCIRESALELVDMGMYSKKTYDDLFGVEGIRAGHIIMNNAYLENYDEMVTDVQNCSDANLVHPQNVLELYSYTRTQTKIDSETGIAEEASLRTMRVLKKGLTFNAYVDFSKANEEERKLFKNAIGITKHIGLNRTRGLGLVDIKITTENLKENKQLEVKDSSKTDLNKLTYTIHLKSNVLCKSVEGDQTKSQDYIEASKILGLLFEKLGKEKYKQLDNIIVSNAYISKNDERSTPLQVSLQKLKDQPFVHGAMEVNNMLYVEQGDECLKNQLTPVTYSWVTKNGEILEVETEIEYHHRRPEDKSIGHALGDGEGEFYQINSIHNGQAFQGFIIASKEQMCLIKEAFTQMKVARLGSFKQSEYGDIYISDVSVSDVVNDNKPMTKEFAIKLNSPVVIYNEYLVPSSDVHDFRDYLSKKLGCELELVKSFIKYETIGGFNVTWHRRKQTIKVLGKGTVCKFRCDHDIDVSCLEHTFIGERTMEGYGEVELVNDTNKKVIIKKSQETNNGQVSKNSEIINALIQLRNKNKSLVQARESAKETGMVSQAALSKLIIIFKEQDGLCTMLEQIDGIEKDSTRKDCLKMYDHIKELVEISTLENAYELLGRAYLTQMKYEVKIGGEH